MFTSNQYRDKAVEYGKRAAIAVTANERQEYHDLQQHFTELADDTLPLYDNQHKAVSALESNRAGMPIDAKGVKCVIDACDDAWRSLQGSIFTAVPRATETREFLRQNIIEAALRGERDVTLLRDNAIRDFGLHCSGRSNTDSNGKNW
jgi:hypothetical protein